MNTDPFPIDALLGPVKSLERRLLTCGFKNEEVRRITIDVPAVIWDEFGRLKGSTQYVLHNIKLRRVP